MPNGGGLTGNTTTTQSALIIPKPGNPLIFYVFTLGPVGGSMDYSEVDMTLDGGLGGVVAATKNTTLLTASAEKVTAILQSNGQDYWVVGHAAPGNSYYSFAVTTAGVNLVPVVSNLGITYNTIDAQGSMKLSPIGNRIADLTPSSNTLQISDFDDATGVVSNNMSIFSPAAIYGVEFSPDGSKLYVSGGHVVAQYDLNAGNIVAIEASETILYNGTAWIGQCQLAPDGKIYVSEVLSGFLGVVNNPNAGGGACNYVASGFTLAAPSSVVGGLPNFIPSFLPIVDFQDTNPCFGDTTNFTLTGPAPDSVIWSFGDTITGPLNASTVFGPTHLFSDTGSFLVTLYVYHNNIYGSLIIDTVSNLIEIITIPQVELGDDTALCDGQSIILEALSTGATYLWQDGSTNSFDTVTQANHYWVEVTNVCGVASDSINVDYDFPLTVNLGADTVICSDNSYWLVPELAPSSIGSYLWQNGSDSSHYFIDQPGTYTLVVSNLCGNFPDTLKVAYEVPPTIELGENQVFCIGETRTLDATFSLASYQWNTGSISPTIDVSSTGTYRVTVSNLCGTAQDEITIDFDEPLGVNLDGDPFNCQGDTVWLEATAPNQPFYNWSTGANTATIPATASGRYWVQVINTCGKFEDDIVLYFQSPPPVDFGPDTTLCEGTTLVLKVPPGTSEHSWQDGSKANSFQIQEPGQYSILASNKCGVASDTIQIDFRPQPEISLGNDTNLCFSWETYELSAYRPNIVSYLWQDNSSQATFQIERSGEYEVIVTDQWGCSAKDEINIGQCPVTLFIPNSFTPNVDGLNDSFGAVGENITEFNMRIYNRWGELIFHSPNIFDQWDGTSGGKLAPTGTYTYRVSYKIENGQTELLIGKVTLYR